MKYLIDRASELVRGGHTSTCTVRVVLDARLCEVLEALRQDDDHIGVTALRVLGMFAAAVCGDEFARGMIMSAMETGPWFRPVHPNWPQAKTVSDLQEMPG